MPWAARRSAGRPFEACQTEDRIMLLRRLAAGLALAALLAAGCSKCCLHPGTAAVSNAPPCCGPPAPPCCGAGGPAGPGVADGFPTTPPPGAVVVPPGR